jgi:cytochrome b subunit of formate dehydrogenase
MGGTMIEPRHAAGGRVERHRLAERIYHWLMAASMLILLGTGFLPVLGFRFAWVDPHWIAGLVLTILVLFHIIRAVTTLTLSTIWAGWTESSNATRATCREAIGGPRIGKRSGKYSTGQKLFHHAVAVVVLVAIVTGLIMMVGIDGPFWERDPLFIPAKARGLVFVLHGFAGLFSITMIMVHVYFACRPEKMYMTRSMLRGWITRQEYERHHDPALWNPEPEESKSGHPQSKSGHPPI